MWVAALHTPRGRPSLKDTLRGTPTGNAVRLPGPRGERGEGLQASLSEGGRSSLSTRDVGNNENVSVTACATTCSKCFHGGRILLGLAFIERVTWQ